MIPFLSVLLSCFAVCLIVTQISISCEKGGVLFRKLKIALTGLLLMGSAFLYIPLLLSPLRDFFSSEGYASQAAYDRLFGAYGWVFWVYFGAFLSVLFVLIPFLFRSSWYMIGVAIIAGLVPHFERTVIYLSLWTGGGL